MQAEEDLVKTTYTVKQVSKMLDVQEVTLRSWERELNLKISRDTNKYRLYTMSDIELLLEKDREEQRQKKPSFWSFLKRS